MKASPVPTTPLGPGRELAVVAVVRGWRVRDVAAAAAMPYWKVAAIMRGARHPSAIELSTLTAALFPGRADGS